MDDDFSSLRKKIHKTIKKVNEDIESFSFNTAVSAFMVCVNELHKLQCNKRDVLMLLVKLLSPFAPFLSEELWYLLGNNKPITKIIISIQLAALKYSLSIVA